MRKIAIFTGTRAEYGLLYWIIKGLHESADTELQLYVGGTHLSSEFGNTVQQIEQDGFPISARLDFLSSSDTPIDIAKSMGSALVLASETFQRNKPDLLVVLGDRFEAMAICQAAMLECLPIAHIHGGETTEGLIDEAVRHSITKMSHIHFTSTEVYRKRVIQLGESPEKVFNVGAPGIDNVKSLALLDRKSLSDSLDFDVMGPFLVVTYHPVTLDKNGAINALNNLLSVLATYSELKFIITYPNADTHGRSLIEVLQEFSRRYSDQVLLVQSLGQLRYISLLKHCELVVGNSSSGLIEAPAFNKPTVNIGRRQGGRLSGDTVINCDEDLLSISRSLKKAMTEDFKVRCDKSHNPYGNGGSSRKILEIIKDIPLDNLIFKQFYNLKL
jgi:UDP-N-acetylglucosamine 2-epimerase (non-hydrolysing)/GDP/UDP-N,N'-diacetylbacillosamine 2-epimerase (hydrolysing)